jgi:hypothetical protein
MYGNYPPITQVSSKMVWGNNQGLLLHNRICSCNGILPINVIQKAVKDLGSKTKNQDTETLVKDSFYSMICFT